MNKEGLIVNILPNEVLSKIKNSISADIIHEEFHEVEDKKYIGTLVFEKYFFRVKNRVALVVIADNFDNSTKVRVISTASSEGILLNFDWGASDSFIREVENILSNNIISRYNS